MTRCDDWPDFKTGLNPYGMAYHLGIQGSGSPRRNPKGAGLEEFIRIGTELGAKALELFDPWLRALEDEALRDLGRRLAGHGITPIVSTGLTARNPDNAFRSASLLDAPVIRLALTSILCGDRAECRDWPRVRAETGRRIRELGMRAAKEGRLIGIENHQDFTSLELVEFCESGPGIGITYDTGNSFPVAEAPMDFSRVVAPHVCLLHLKDYRVQFTAEGFRLVRCATGDGAVPLADIFSILGQHHRKVTAVIEIGALEARHVRLFTPGWWAGYPPRSAQQLAACLLAAGRNHLAEDADYRTPWERGADDELAAYELEMVRKSVANMKALEIM